MRRLMLVALASMFVLPAIGCRADDTVKQGIEGEFCNNRDDDCRDGHICQDGQCGCRTSYPTDCGEKGCWGPNTDCDTIGFCSAEDGCMGCYVGSVSSCCGGDFVCCAVEYPHACSDGKCYENPSDCTAHLCDLTPALPCP